MNEQNNNEVKSSEKVSVVTGPKVNVLMGILSYLGPLIIISYLVAKDDPFVKFHIKQGLILVIINLILWVLAPNYWHRNPVVDIINFAIFILAIIGIVNVIQKKEKKLPIVGSLSSYLTF